MNRHGERERGYVLFGIAIGLVILGIAMTAAVPLWQKVLQREREQELIFRGYQYMQAIELYQRKYPGAYPADTEVLFKEKFLRKLYTDPFSEDGGGAFRILQQMSPELQRGALDQQRAAGEAAGITSLNRSQARMRTPGGQSLSGSGQKPAGGFQSTLGRGASDASMGGIVGVASASDEETFYKVPGKEKYKDWLFVYGAQQAGIGQVGQVGLGQIEQAQQARPARRARQTVQAGQAGQARQRTQPSPFGQQPGGGGQQRLPGQSQRNVSPFQGLPPPPGFTIFRFGASPSAGVPGQAVPGQPGTGLPGQPGLGAPGANAPGQSGFEKPSARQPNLGQPGSQPRQQR